MIKKDDFLDAVGNLDSEIVDQYLDMHEALLEKKQAKTPVKQTSGQSRNKLHALLPVAAVLLVLSVLTVSLLLPMNRKTPPLPPVDGTETTVTESGEESTDFEETSAETEQTSPIYQDSHLTPDGRLDYWQSINAVVVEWGKITDKRCKTSDHLIVIDEEHPAPPSYPYGGNDGVERLYITYVGVELNSIEPYWETMDDSITSWDEVLAKKYVWIPEDYLDVIQEGGRAVLFVIFMENAPEIRVLGDGYKLFGEVYLTHRLWPITEDDIIQIPSFCEGVYGEDYHIADTVPISMYKKWDYAFDKANRELPMYVNIRDGMTLEEWNYYLDCILYEYNYENIRK